eukprot:CAMPEP_0174735360 /NCGR_PEP_ID=MMETSP1094-20130205/64836_1 /TAXON_ID=156173 /ORGANISM="Chrysochromulina brevifilum, Strain UTEX LB 985" /LENGTH=69 /DNA_ID=CAMNT_0015938315 /DNA_START=359 /DNA_END=565 /DNA_ORIENTATION=+
MRFVNESERCILIPTATSMASPSPSASLASFEAARRLDDLPNEGIRFIRPLTPVAGVPVAGMPVEEPED